MANLNTKTISDGVGDILAVDGGITGSSKQIKDGDGTGSPLRITTSYVGIGGDPLDDLHIRGTASPTLRISDTDATDETIAYSTLTDGGDSTATWTKFGFTDGNVQIALNPRPTTASGVADGTSSVTMFRATDSSGTKALKLYLGDNTTDLRIQISPNNLLPTYFHCVKDGDDTLSAYGLADRSDTNDMKFIIGSSNHSELSSGFTVVGGNNDSHGVKVKETTPGFNAGIVASFQRTWATTSNCFIGIIGGNDEGTLTSSVGVRFGSEEYVSAGEITYRNTLAHRDFRFRVGGNNDSGDSEAILGLAISTTDVSIPTTHSIKVGGGARFGYPTITGEATADMNRGLGGTFDFNPGTENVDFTFGSTPAKNCVFIIHRQNTGTAIGMWHVYTGSDGTCAVGAFKDGAYITLDASGSADYKCRVGGLNISADYTVTQLSGNVRITEVADV